MGCRSMSRSMRACVKVGSLSLSVLLLFSLLVGPNCPVPEVVSGAVESVDRTLGIVKSRSMVRRISAADGSGLFVSCWVVI